MGSRIVFLVQNHFQRWEEVRYGLATLECYGFIPEVWEAFDIVRPAYARAYSPPEPSRWHGIRRFRKLGDILCAIKELGPEDRVITFLRSCWAADMMYKYCKTSGAKLGWIAIRNPGDHVSDFSDFPRKPSTRSRWRNLLSMETLGGVLYRRLPSFAKYEWTYDFVIACGGEKCLETVAEANRSDTEVVWAHQSDYDTYLSLRVDVPASAPPRKYWVFLDQFIPGHPDAVARVDAESYYREMNAAFDELEALTKSPVCVASHPKSTLSNIDNPWQGREALRGETGRLVWQAQGIIAHYSVSINLGILCARPLLLYLPASMTKTRHEKYVYAYAQALAQEVATGKINERMLAESPANRKGRYDGYIKKYIKREDSPELMMWDLVCEKWLHAAKKCSRHSA